MPSWPIHLALANKLKKRFNLNDDFIIGNVLPDILNGYMIKNPSKIIESSKTHENIPKNINNQIELGYLIHIETDNYFNEYFYKKHILIKDNIKYVILNDGSLFYDKNIKPYEPKQKDFKIYGDKLTNENLLGNIINKNNQTDNLVKQFQITSEDLTQTIEKINYFITNKSKYNNNYQVFAEEELDSLFENCYKHLSTLIENLQEDSK